MEGEDVWYTVVLVVGKKLAHVTQVLAVSTVEAKTLAVDGRDAVVVAVFEGQLQVVDEGGRSGVVEHCCARCGGENVEHAMWVRLNTEEVLDVFGSWCHGDNSWCDDCEDHTDISSDEP